MQPDRRALLVLAVLACACAKPSEGGSDASATAEQTPDATAPSESVEGGEAVSGRQVPAPRPPEQRTPNIVRKDLVAQDLPPVPTLETLAVTPAAAGELGFPKGSDELAPRAAVMLGGGLLLAGQAYLDRQPGRPPQTWRWLGFVPSEGEPSSTRLEPGAIRAAVASPDGGALLAGTRGTGFDVRGWFGVVDASATLGLSVELDTPNSTELFDLLPGADETEVALLAGYVDAQGWVVSLDAGGEQRWQKFVGSYGYTQIRAIARLTGGESLAIGSRAQGFGEAWWGRIPRHGGADPSPDDVAQDKLTIAGADQHQALYALVDLGDAGLVALGTAKRNYIQDHDQVLAVGFDRAGQVSWSKVLEGVRATEVLGGREAGEAAQFVVAVPGPDTAALALVDVTATGEGSARQLQDSAGWSSAGFVEGSASGELLSYRVGESAIAWRRLPLAD